MITLYDRSNSSDKRGTASGATQHDAGVGHERAVSCRALSALFERVIGQYPLLPIKTKRSSKVHGSPSRNYSFNLEITFV